MLSQPSIRILINNFAIPLAANLHAETDTQNTCRQKVLHQQLSAAAAAAAVVVAAAAAADAAVADATAAADATTTADETATAEAAAATDAGAAAAAAAAAVCSSRPSPHLMRSSSAEFSSKHTYPRM